MDYQKLVLENIRDRVYVLRRDGEIVFATPSVKALGYEVSEVIGRKIYELVDEKYRERIIETLKSLKDGAELRFRVLGRRRGGRRFWVEATARKVGEYAVVVSRDISRLASFETLLRATVDLLKNVPGEADELENILRKYFVDAKFSEEVQKLTIRAGEITIPVKVQDRVMGSLTLSLPDWFEICDEDLEILNIIGECVAENMLMLKSRKVVRNSLIALKAASENLALLVDRIRNPLAAINGLVEVKVGGEVYEKVHEQINAIEEIVRTLDEEWEKVDKLADKLIEAFTFLERLEVSEVALDKEFPRVGDLEVDSKK